MDAHLRIWEVFAGPGPFSAPRPARITFHCVSEFGVGSRSAEKDMDHAAAERLVQEASIAELTTLLEQAAKVSETGSPASRVPQPMG